MDRVPSTACPLSIRARSGATKSSFVCHLVAHCVCVSVCVSECVRIDDSSTSLLLVVRWSSKLVPFITKIRTRFFS